MNHIVLKESISKYFKISFSNKGEYFICGLLGFVCLNFLFYRKNLKIFAVEKNKIILFFSTANIFKVFVKQIFKSIKGVSYGWLLELYFKGRGFNVFILNNYLKLNIGFSHSISYKIPKNILIKCDKEKILIYGIDLNTVFNLGSRLRFLRRIDNYSGYGIRYKNELVLLKSGKKK